jgi:hypothetical protein
LSRNVCSTGSGPNQSLRENIHDVEVTYRPTTLIAVAGLNEPLVANDRYRRAGMMVMRKKFGSTATIKKHDEIFPAALIGAFIRYEVTP